MDTPQKHFRQELFRRLGPLGFGCGPIGNLYRAVTDDTAQNALRSAFHTGISYFDTAPFYGFGLSEKRLGAELSSLSPEHDNIVVSTKVGRRLCAVADGVAPLRHGFASMEPMEPVFDYSYDGIMYSFEESLQRLGVDSVDILLAHDLGEFAHGAAHREKMREFLDGGYRAMDELKRDGATKALGIGANEWEVGTEALAHVDLDCFLLAGRYTLLDQCAAQTFFPLCAERDVAVIAAGPFNSGILATGLGNVAPGTVLHYNYAPASDAIIEKVRKLELVCSRFNVKLAAAALQFPLAHQQVCTVLAGLATPEEVDNAVALIRREIPGEFWQNLGREGLIAEYAAVPDGAVLSVGEVASGNE